jgi:hypothetical protein
MVAHMSDQLKQRPGDQPLPVVNDELDIQSRVIADIEERRKVGIQRYGTALQPHNGRDALRDLYEELLDGAMYARQLMVERPEGLAEAIREGLAAYLAGFLPAADSDINPGYLADELMEHVIDGALKSVR